jgi:hypothetical protein
MGESLDWSEESRFETVESSCAECEVVSLYNGYTLGYTGDSRGRVTSLTLRRPFEYWPFVRSIGLTRPADS